MSSVSEDSRITLLEAKDSSDKSGAAAALENGRIEAIEAFIRIVQKNLNASQANALFIRILDEVTPVLRMSLYNGDSRVIEGLRKLLPPSPPNAACGLLAEMATKSLRHAIEMGHGTAVKTYAEIVTSAAATFSSAQRKILLDASRGSQGSRIMGKIRNSRHYDTMMQADSGCYAAFKDMKAALAL